MRSPWHAQAPSARVAPPRCGAGEDTNGPTVPVRLAARGGGMRLNPPRPTEILIRPIYRGGAPAAIPAAATAAAAATGSRHTYPTQLTPHRRARGSGWRGRGRPSRPPPLPGPCRAGSAAARAAPPWSLPPRQPLAPERAPLTSAPSHRWGRLVERKKGEGPTRARRASARSELRNARVCSAARTSSAPVVKIAAAQRIGPLALITAAAAGWF